MMARRRRRRICMRKQPKHQPSCSSRGVVKRGFEVSHNLCCCCLCAEPRGLAHGPECCWAQPSAASQEHAASTATTTTSAAPFAYFSYREALEGLEINRFLAFSPEAIARSVCSAGRPEATVEFECTVAAGQSFEWKDRFSNQLMYHRRGWLSCTQWGDCMSKV